MSKKYTEEFKRDVVAMVHQSGASRSQIARDFGVSKSALSAWLQKDELEQRGLGRVASAGDVGGDAAALRQALKRIRLLEQEAEVMRSAVAYLSQAALPK